MGVTNIKKPVELELQMEQLRPMSMNSPDACQNISESTDRDSCPRREQMELCKTNDHVHGNGSEEKKHEEVGLKEEEEEDDGFRTPTSLEHKIPVVKECPPAPKKPRSEPAVKKRKTSPNSCRVHLDLTQEMEWLFRPLFEDSKRVIKKTRTSFN